MQPRELHRILIVKLSSLGDVVHALPVARALRTAHPAARITWAVEDWLAPLVAGHSAIDRVIVFPRMRAAEVSPRWFTRLARAFSELRSETYDVAVDLQGLLKSSTVALLSRAPMRLGVPPQREGSRFVSVAVPVDPSLHAVQRYLRVARHLGANDTSAAFDIPISADTVANVDRLLVPLAIPSDRELIVIAPSTSRPHKDWPTARWRELLERIGPTASVILVGTTDQRHRHGQLARGAGAHVHDLTGETSLSQLIALLARCDLHIAADCGSLHLAAALGRRVVALFGPTDPRQHGPYGHPDAVLTHRELCDSNCPRHCPRRFACVGTISPEEVIGKWRTGFG